MTAASGGAPTTVYLDHAATTPMYPAALEALTAAASTVGNAASIHGSGRSARRRLEESRESLAADLGAHPSEVIFTSGGTEGDNLAVKGMFWARRAADPRRTRILVAPTEHHAVLDTVAWLQRHDNAQVTWLPVDDEGVVTPAVLRSVLADCADEVALLTVMWANNEIGTIAPMAELVSVATQFGIPVHSDAVQAAAGLPIAFGDSGLAALSIAGHKLGGPQGVGALLLRREVTCVPLFHGGGHEREVRSGTVPVPVVVGMAAAVRQTVRELPEQSARLRALRERLIQGVVASVPQVVLNGPRDAGRLPGNANLTFPGCDGDSLLMLLDAAGVECSLGSACSAGVSEPSHVLVALGVDRREARSALRFSLGHTSTAADVDRVLEVLPQVVRRATAAGRAATGGR